MSDRGPAWTAAAKNGLLTGMDASRHGFTKLEIKPIQHVDQYAEIGRPKQASKTDMNALRLPHANDPPVW
jgi:hypothetical protein